MSTPILFILLPALAAGGLWILRNQKVLTAVLAAGLCVFLMVLTLGLRLDIPIGLGPLTVSISSTLDVLGRKFVLGETRLPILRFMYGFSAAWFLGSLLTRAHRFFVPVGLLLVAILVAALSVEPFLYSALLIEIAVLISIPLFLPPGSRMRQGVVRFVIFQTLALPFILYAGWAAAGVEANPSNQTLLLQAVLMLALGFAFWLAVFPFYAWMPRLAEETDPYIFGFVLTFLFTVVLLLGLDFLNAYVWLWNFPTLSVGLRLVGTVMVVTGGIWAGFERSLKRIFAYGLIIENGFLLIALSIHSAVGVQAYVSMFLPNMVLNFVWAAVLTLIGRTTSLTLQGINGRMRSQPIYTAALLTACFSAAGLPLLAFFPLRLVILEELAGASLVSAAWALFGSFGLAFAGFNLLTALANSTEKVWKITENWLEVVVLAAGILFLLFFGIFPGWFYNVGLQMLQSFSRFI